jgi:hypothetical protein
MVICSIHPLAFLTIQLHFLQVIILIKLGYYLMIILKDLKAHLLHFYYQLMPVSFAQIRILFLYYNNQILINMNEYHCDINLL